MNIGGGEAADQMVRMMLSGGEVAVRLTGSAAKNLLAISLALAKSHKKVSGRLRMGSAVHALELQMDSLREFAERYGIQVAGTTQEIAAGGNEDRAGLQELKHAAAAGKMDYVLVRSRDRLIRNPDLRLLLTYECGLQSLGVDILYMGSQPD